MMIKNIPRPKLSGARQLTPLEMNNLHFRPPKKHTPVLPATKSNT